MASLLRELEQAPDRETAALLLLAAVHEDVRPDVLHQSWNRWQSGQQVALPEGAAA